MNLLYLAIDKDEDVHNRELALWLKHGISSIRVSSMTEGILYPHHMFRFILIPKINLCGDYVQ